MPIDERVASRQEDAQPEGHPRRRRGLRRRTQADASHGAGKILYMFVYSIYPSIYLSMLLQ